MFTFFGKIIEQVDGSQSLQSGSITYVIANQQSNVIAGNYYAVQGEAVPTGFDKGSIIPTITLTASNISSSFSLKNLAAGNFPQNTYLNGLTQTGDIGLSPSASGIYTGANWKAETLPAGGFALKCLGAIHNPDYVYLNIADGGVVNLVANTSEANIGTHLEVESLNGGSYAFNSRPTATDIAYLNGVPQNGGVCTAPNTAGINIGTHWQVC